MTSPSPLTRHSPRCTSQVCNLQLQHHEEFLTCGSLSQFVSEGEGMTATGRFAGTGVHTFRSNTVTVQRQTISTSANVSRWAGRVQIERLLGAEKGWAGQKRASLEGHTASEISQLRKACSLLKRAAASKTAQTLPQKSGHHCH